MREPLIPNPDEPYDSQGRLQRREDRRHEIRRHRLLAATALGVVVLVLAAIVAGALGGGSGKQPMQAEARRSGLKVKAGAGSSGKVRNATRQPGWRPYVDPVPILEYHVLGAPEPDAPYPELYVGRSDFRRQMNWLDSRGYEAVTLEAVEDAWYHGGTLPQKPLVISFDDGYRPQFTYALPELRKHGWPGVLNLKAEGSDLYASNVEAMVRAGWEVAAHTIHHLDLTTLDAGQLREEVAGSREMLRREYGVPVENFCYPAGRFNPTVVAAVEEAGYVGATTEIPGYATPDHPYELERFEILRSSGVPGLAADLRSGL